MQIIHKLNIHLDQRQLLPAVEAVQGETGRVVSVTLYENGAPWPIPEAATVAVRYGKPDLTGGIYETLPDGEKACTIDGSTITVALPAQMLAVAGIVTMQLMVCAEGSVLTTFSINVRVEADPSAGTGASEDYVNLLPEAIEAAQLSMSAASQAQKSATAAHNYAENARITAASITSRYNLTYTPHWVSETTGQLFASDVTITSQLFPVLGGAVGVAFPGTMAVRLCYYDRNGAYLSKDSLCFDSFRRTGLMAAFARVEAIYASGSPIVNIEEMASQLAVYVPAAGLEDVERAVVASAAAQEHANYTYQQSLLAEEAKLQTQRMLGLQSGALVNIGAALCCDSDGYSLQVTPTTLTNTKLTLERSQRINTKATRMVCYVDFSGGTMGFYNRCADHEEMTVYAAKPIGFPVQAGRTYIISLTKRSSDTHTLRITDGQSLIGDEMTCPAYDVGSGCGLLRDLYLENGQLGTVSRLQAHLRQPRKPRVLLLGDEFVTGDALRAHGEYRSGRYATLLSDALGGSCFIAGCADATAQQGALWFDEFLKSACQPDFVMVSLGSNDTDFADWQSAMQRILDHIDTLGATPILMTQPNGPLKAQQNQWIRSSGWNYIDAAAVIGDDPSHRLEDGTHLSAEGHQLVLRRAQLDAPYLFQ